MVYSTSGKKSHSRGAREIAGIHSVFVKKQGHGAHVTSATVWITDARLPRKNNYIWLKVTANAGKAFHKTQWIYAGKIVK